MSYLQSFILGVVEGFTEFLPISSTAHLVLVAKFLKIIQTDFVKTFEITTQFGAIAAVIWIYWRKILINKEILKKIFVAFLPTAVLGLLLYKIFKTFFIENLNLIAWAMFLGGLLLIIFELYHREKIDDIGEIEKISYRQSFLIGCCQAVAIVPGVSRSAATILGGLFLGLKRQTIVEFSFLLAVPTMLAATIYDLFKSGAQFSINQFGVLSLGFLVAFLVAVVAIKFLLRYIQRNSFIWFGIYRLVLALIIFVFFI